LSGGDGEKSSHQRKSGSADQASEPVQGGIVVGFDVGDWGGPKRTQERDEGKGEMGDRGKLSKNSKIVNILIAIEERKRQWENFFALEKVIRLGGQGKVLRAVSRSTGARCVSARDGKEEVKQRKKRVPSTSQAVSKDIRKKRNSEV